MKRKTKSSWKTTLFGALAGLAGLAAMVPEPHCQAIAPIVSAASLALLGVNARDNKVRSADVHGETTQPEYVPAQQIGRPGGTRPLE
jgi:hypothetical protein